MTDKPKPHLTAYIIGFCACLLIVSLAVNYYLLAHTVQIGYTPEARAMMQSLIDERSK